MTDKASPKTNQPDADEAAIRGLLDLLMEGWNRGSGEEFAAAFAEDGDFVAFDGRSFRGRREISPLLQGLLDKWLKGTRLVGRVESVRFLGPDVALMHTVGSQVARGETGPSTDRDSIQTLVATRLDGGWRLAAFHNTRVRPISGATFLIWAFTDLPWKILSPAKGDEPAQEADPTQTRPESDEAAIRNLFDELLEDWARGDGGAYGSRFTEDADYVAFDGSHTKGREEISSSHQQLFDRFLKGTRLTGRIESPRFLTPNVALVRAYGSTVMRGKTKPSPERLSVQTLVVVRENARWRFAAFHNTRVRPLNNAATFLTWALADQLWKVFGAGRRAVHG